MPMPWPRPTGGRARPWNEMLRFRFEFRVQGLSVLGQSANFIINYHILSLNINFINN
jgi:hypothetical protein